MRMRVRVVGQLVAMNVMMTLEYRGAFFLHMVNTVATPLISLLVWLTVSEQGVRLPYSRSQFVTYYVGLSLVSMATSSWLAEYLAQDIRLGGLSPWLLRPTPYMAHYLANNLGEKLIKLPLLLPLLGLVAVFFRHDLRLPTGIGPWALFAIALPCAATVAFLLDVVLGSLAFWLQDVRGLIRAKDLLSAFLGGRLVPLSLFPPALAGLLDAQPFRYTLSFPLEVLAGGLSGRALLSGFAWQIGYCLILYAAYRLLWRRGLRSYSATGA